MTKTKGVTYTTMIMTDGTRSVYATYRVRTRTPRDRIRKLNLHKAEQIATIAVDSRDHWGVEAARDLCLATSQRHATAEFPAFEWGRPC